MNPAVWITIILITILLLNIIAVPFFGEAEFWFASADDAKAVADEEKKQVEALGGRMSTPRRATSCGPSPP